MDEKRLDESKKGGEGRRIDRTRTAREYITQHAGIRRRGRYIDSNERHGEGREGETFRGVPGWRRHRCVAVETWGASFAVHVCENSGNDIEYEDISVVVETRWG